MSDLSNLSNQGTTALNQGKEKFSELKKNAENIFDYSNISGIINLILSLFKLPEPPVEPLPPPLIMVGASLRPGMSAKAVASRIIARQSEAGLPVGDVFADGDNTSEAMLAIHVDEVINTMLNESVVNVVIPPGTAVTAVGANLGGPVVVQGFTTSMGIGNGIMR
jgi:hypothetical protein